MKVVSLNVGVPREIEWRGHTVRTSIYKTSADRRLRVTTLNLEGDQQADLSVHGASTRPFMLIRPSTMRIATKSFRKWTFPGDSSARI